MPRSATFLLCDPDQFRMAMPELRVNLVVTGPGVFEAQVNRVKLKHTLLLSCDENLPRVAHISLDLHSACLLFLTREAATAAVAGTEVEFGDLIFCGRGQRFYMRTTGPLSWGCFLLMPSRLSGAPRLSARQKFERPECSWVAKPARPLIRRLLRLHRRAVLSKSSLTESVSDTGSAAELERLLIEAARECLPSALERKAAASDQKHREVMNRFHDMVEASRNGLLSQAELQDNLGVSGRALRSYCHQHLGMGPARYLRLYRLKLVRRTLLRADPANSTVRQISSQYGFHEAGRFSVVYRTLFGESPSASLHRTPDSSSALKPDVGCGFAPKLHSAPNVSGLISVHPPSRLSTERDPDR